MEGEKPKVSPLWRAERSEPKASAGAKAPGSGARGCSSARSRTSACHAEDRGFKSHHPREYFSCSMKKQVFIISFFIFFFLFLFVFFEVYFPKDPNSKEQILFEIKRGEGLREISQNLKEKGIIKNATLFQLYTFLNGTSRQLKAGYYFLSPAFSFQQLVEKFAKGKVAKERVTIPEGFTLKEIQERLKETILIKGDISQLKVKDFKEEFDFLKEVPENSNLEGFLFPDTYEFFYGEKAEEIARKMLTNFGQKINAELRKEIERQGKSIYQIVIMASMLEKEVKTLEDKKLVSGILWKRLEKAMPLQVDATINFITGKKTIKISLEDLQIDSPYNTYKYKGLPIGPISNPGLDSILAAIYPKESEFWYYLSLPEGKTIFTKTLQEHNFFKAKYLK